MAKKPRNRKSRDPKSVQKNALYFEPQLSLREAKKAKYVTFSTDFPEIRHTPKFVPKKIVTFQAAQRWQNRYLSASLRHRETPIKQARNRVWGNLDASWGPNSPSWRAKCDQIPLLQHIYIYISLELSGVICANRFARFARIGWFARIRNSSDLCESAWRAIKIGVSIANDSRESIRANRVANRPCH